jgi:hypothetical protein
MARAWRVKVGTVKRTGSTPGVEGKHQACVVQLQGICPAALIQKLLMPFAVSGEGVQAWRAVLLV